jgi:hypothetical protein
MQRKGHDKDDHIIPADLLTAAQAHQHHSKDGLWIGMICGLVSGGLEGIDVDLKYDLSGQLWNRLCEDLHAALPDVMQELVIQRTVSAGRHLIYRCATIQGNQPNIAKRMDGAVLIETRGEGGYLACWPSPGYELEQGSWDAIPTITAQQRDVMLSICRSFDEREEQQPEPRKSSQRKASGGLSPLEDYRQRGDAIDLLQRHGWTRLHQRGDRMYLRRPGKDDGQSANWSLRHRKLYLHSSSTTLDAGKAYSIVDLYAHYEAGGDLSRAAKKLLAEGYGEQRKDDPFTASSSSSAQADEEADEPELRRMSLEDMYDELVDIGAPIPTGIAKLDDEGVKIRASALTIVAAQPGAGKSMFLVNMMLAMAKEHPSKAMIFFSGEMPASEVLQRMLTASMPDDERRRSRLLADAGPHGGAYLWAAYHGQPMLYVTPQALRQGDRLAVCEEDSPPVRQGDPRPVGQRLDREVHGEHITTDGELVDAIMRLARQQRRHPKEVLDRLWAMKHPSRDAQQAGMDKLQEDTGSTLSFDLMPIQYAIGHALDQVLPMLEEGRLRIVSAREDKLPIAQLQQHIDALGQMPIGAVFMDYATLMMPSKDADKEMRIRMVASANELKGAAKRWQAPIIVAAQTNVRDADGGGWKPSQGALPQHYYEALGKPSIPSGDVLAETSQFQRASACTIYLTTPTQMAGGTIKELLKPWDEHGEMPIYLSVVKNRGGKGGLFFPVAWRPCCGQITSAVSRPPGIRLAEDSAGRGFSASAPQDDVVKKKKEAGASNAKVLKLQDEIKAKKQRIKALEDQLKQAVTTYDDKEVDAAQLAHDKGKAKLYDEIGALEAEIRLERKRGTNAMKQ